MNCDNCVIYDSTNPCGQKKPRVGPKDLRYVTGNCVFLGKVHRFSFNGVVHINELEEWLLDFCIGKFGMGDSKGVKFEKNEDAAMFMLRWG